MKPCSECGFSLDDSLEGLVRHWCECTVPASRTSPEEPIVLSRVGDPRVVRYENALHLIATRTAETFIREIASIALNPASLISSERPSPDEIAEYLERNTPSSEEGAIRMSRCCRHREDAHRTWTNLTESFTVCLGCDEEEWSHQSVFIEDMDELCAAVDRVAKHEYRPPGQSDVRS